MTKSDKALLIIFTTFILIMGSLIFILPQKDFSASENRYLAKMPSFSVRALLDGEFTKEISKKLGIGTGEVALVNNLYNSRVIV